MDGSGEQLDNAHLMRMAGRFSRRVQGVLLTSRDGLIRKSKTRGRVQLLLAVDN